MSTDIFNITAKVYNSTNYTNLETENGPILISLELTPVSATVSGTSIQGASALNTTSGVALFSNAQILSSGSFNLTATGPGLQSATISSLTVKNFVKTINITSSTESTISNENFDVYVHLYGDDNFAFIESTTVTLIPTNPVTIPSSNLTTINGSVTFYNIYENSNSIALVTFSATTTSDSSHVIVNEATVLFISGSINISLSNTVIII